MKRLSNQDWSLIARYLKEEASQTDLAQLNTLLQAYPNLKEELQHMDRNVNVSDHPSSTEFDADQAFQKLHERFKRENLL
jgi:hypothetical protein